MRARAKKNHKAEKTTMGSFRIIGGQWRSRRLSFPDSEGLRPTTDRVRETVFNWLSPELPGARVLDLFAGSGALGIEALSRGAGELIAVELDRKVAAQLSANRDLLGAHFEVVCADAISWLPSASERFDLVFLDPPFRKGLLAELVEALAHSDILTPDALIYVEQEKEATLPSVPANWSLMKEKVAGQVSYRLYRNKPLEAH